MRKRFIWILVALMSVALIALIYLQFMWIKNAIEVERDNFYNVVEKSLSEIVKAIDAKETVLYRQEELTAFSSKNNKYGLSDQVNIELIDSSKHWFRTKSISDQDSTFFKISTSRLHDHSAKDNTQLKDIKLLDNNRIYVDVLTKKFKRRKINQKERINKTTLETIINDILHNNNITRKYEYAVVTNNRSEIFSSNSFNLKSDPKLFHKKLFPNDYETEDIINTEYTLLLYFPRSITRVESMPWIIITSIILTFIILFIFSSTIYVILKQKRISEIKNDFINNMTHELKTPISTISLASQMLKDSSVSKNTTDYSKISEIIGIESKRLGNHVEKVLQMATMDKESSNFKQNNINIHDLLEQIVNNISLKVKENNGSISHEFKATRSTVLGDEVHLSNMIINLIDNAIKYCKEKPVIEVKTYNDDKFLTISIKDQGIGITKDNQKKIFDQFYRVPTGNRHDVKGFGLGLSYVKKIVEQHKGHIDLKSEKNKGSEFKITLLTIE